MNVKNGKRWSSGHQLLTLNRPNLRIETSAFVEKVLFKANYEAYAVRFTQNSQTRTVRAKKAIVLSSGAIGSPKILMHSGVGPRAHLESLGIKTVADLPVGENLQDHIATGYDLFSTDIELGFNFASMCSPFTICEYFTQSKGAWMTTGVELIGFDGEGARPQIQLMVMPLGLAFDGGGRLLKASNIKSATYERYFRDLIGKGHVTVLPVLLHPKSRGSVRLSNKNPKSKPLINPNYLSDITDVKTLIKGIGLVKSLGVLQMYKKHFPGCESFEFDTETYWECYVRHLSLTSFHPVGTCKFGNREDGGVVDYNFQVYNTNRLYVVDASVFPTLTSGNVNGAVLMLAEKLSDILKEKDYFSVACCCFMEIFLPKNKCDV